MRYTIKDIAKLITEDPDITNDMSNVVDANKPLTGSEIQNQSRSMAANNDGAKQIADQKKRQQELDKQEEEQKKRLIQPQIQQLDKSMQNVGDGISKNKQSTTDTADSMGELETEMANLNSIIGNLEKQF